MTKTLILLAVTIVTGYSQNYLVQPSAGYGLVARPIGGTLAPTYGIRPSPGYGFVAEPFGGSRAPTYRIAPTTSGYSVTTTNPTTLPIYVPVTPPLTPSFPTFPVW